jgi:hypothetical protein
MAESKDVLNTALQVGSMAGLKGGIVINDTSVHYGQFAGLKTISTGVIISIYSGISDTGSILASTYILSNFEFPMYTTSIQLSTGTIMIFYAST